MNRVLLGLTVLCIVGLGSTAARAQDDPLIVAVNDHNQFAFDLYRQAREVSDGNFVYSPLSVTLALAMTYNGARGQTAADMAAAMHFTLDRATLNQALATLTARLLVSGNAPAGDYEPERRLAIANALWGERTFPFNAVFIQELKAAYGAGLELVDFVRAAEEARQMINGWVEENTNGLIRDIVPAGMVDAMTRLVLANALYFKSNWLMPFRPERTQDQTFTRLDGSAVTVPMMNMQDYFVYIVEKNYQAISLPYGGNYAMEIYLPDAGAFEDFERTFVPEAMLMVRNSARAGEVRLTLPKWKTETNLPMSELLQQMGMASAFSSSADFTGMFDASQSSDPLFISAVLHKAFIAVDENGTEAAAATVVVMGRGGGPGNPPEPYTFVVDRPYLYTIVDQSTGTVLFMGRVLDPSGQ